MWVAIQKINAQYSVSEDVLIIEVLDAEDAERREYINHLSPRIRADELATYTERCCRMRNDAVGLMIRLAEMNGLPGLYIHRYKIDEKGIRDAQKEFYPLEISKEEFRDLDSIKLARIMAPITPRRLE